METVADMDLYLWHFFIWMPGAMNDLNVMAFSPLFQSMIANAIPPLITYTVDGVERTLPYFLCDGIYPEHVVLMDTSKCDEEKDKCFASRHKGRHKDAERVYAVLYTEWHILARPSHIRNVEPIQNVGTCCPIRHDIIVVNRRKEQHAHSPSTYQEPFNVHSAYSFTLIAPICMSPSSLLLTSGATARELDELLLFVPICVIRHSLAREARGSMPSRVHDDTGGLGPGAIGWASVMADGGEEIVEGQDGQPGVGGTAVGAVVLFGHDAPDGGGQADPRKALVQRLQAARAWVTRRAEHHLLKRDLIEHAWAHRPDA